MLNWFQRKAHEKAERHCIYLTLIVHIKVLPLVCRDNLTGIIIVLDLKTKATDSDR